MKNKVKRLFCVIIILTTNIHFISAQNNQDISFEHISIEDGLTTVSVTDIIQDQYGFMWFGSTSGLNKYDGYTISNYIFDTKNQNSISDDVITTLFEDNNGILWIGTEKGGLNKYNRESDSFINYKNLPSDSTSISHNHILKIFEDSQGVFWIGTQGGGLNKMNRKKGTFVNYINTPNSKYTLPNNSVYAILEDSSKQLWVGTLKGISLFNRNTEEFTTYINNPKKKDAIGVYAICEDKQGVLWVGTNRGLHRFNKEDKTFTSYKYDDEIETKNIVYRIYEDSYGNLWTGVWGNGLSKFDKLSGTFTTYKHNPQDENSLGDGSVLSIYADKSNLLWVATGLGGVSIYKPNKASNFIHYKNDANMNSLSAGVITSINENTEGDIWLTNFMGVVDKIKTNGELIRYQDFKKEKQVSHPSAIFDLLENKNKDILIGTYQSIYKLNKSNNSFEHQEVSSNQLLNETIQVRSVVEDKKGMIWLGTIENGLLRIDNENDKYSWFQFASNDSTSISSNSITKVYEDPLGTFWIATEDGLNKMDKEKGTFIRYQNNPSDSTSISNNYINNLFKDRFGSLWIGTNYGINVLDEKSGTFRYFTKKDGLPENTVYAILEDNRNNLWITTNNFLTKFNLNTETFKNFNKGNGMPIDEFYSTASLKASNGKMYFGGINGMIEFHPDSIKNNTYKPPVVITDFKISNQSVSIKKKDSTKERKFYLDKNINVTDTITLSYLDNVFSFEFAALDYFHSPNNQYSYRMKGFNNNWIYTNATNRNATYTNLGAGSYVFDVKGSNNDGIWNDKIKSVVIIITPPWWKTNWAYCLYIICFLASLFGFIQWRASKLNRDKKLLVENVKSKTKDLAKKNNQLDKQNLQLQEQAEKLQQLDETKSKFFANISHEFRTPLTVILGLINKQISNSEINNSKDSETIKRNSQRLLQLINQLLDLSKIESGEVKLNIVKENIISFTKKIILLIESFAKEKNIKITFNKNLLDKEFPNETIDLNFDKERFSKILSNLLSNAIKFTPKNGKISIEIKQQTKAVKICVSNTGAEIPAKSLPYIFNRFYQVDDDTTREYDGTGIGLALVKELVELHQGNISVESNSKTTSFHISIPLNLTLTENNTIIGPSNEDLTLDDIAIHSNNIDSRIDKIKENSEDQLEILVVEDNQDIRNYIKDILEKDYKIIQAVDGKDGLEKAEANIPDLIVSDVMMPKMDGYELCKHLKASEKTNHIPVVLLTAKATQENKLEGLETGADDYLIKPFDEKELQIRIKNLIALRAQLQKNCQQNSWLKPNAVNITSIHQQFIEDIKEIIEKNIDNSQFSVEDLGEEIAMSRSQVHRKLKAITDQSSTQFIRNYRLYRAAELIKQESGNITEIAYQVGFSSQTYFSKCFQELFGSSPSDYKINYN